MMIHIVSVLLLLLVSIPAWAGMTLDGRAEQGGLLLGRVEPGATIRLDGKNVPVDGAGRFLIGFGRDAASEAGLEIRHADGGVESRTLAIAPRAWIEQRIEGLPQAKAAPNPVAQARIRAEAATVAALRERVSLDDGFVGGLIRPADGPISGVFGSRRVYNGAPGAPHSGLDIAAPLGAPVRTAAAGTVILAAPDLFLTGRTVMVDHGLGLITSYAHLSRIDVAEGEHVAAGQHLGAIGASGLATGPHLHFGVSWQDRRLDPETVLAVLPGR
ncbi:M23 family metallopeptidase [Magnetospirillum molischianum]|uniref:Membrane protein related to metalloendopeptidase n=1 Tax=Magnetospirillum molischianum DSM 120 TaxID=1150626 RepID=H8FUA7_MAGML|nr:M23 family metallopeptidase [Magnetospirillum molischianum]CCG41945.1 Membrane protein related to metalloendopeptidase [Magnetospirillum molischianum DSM 120]